MYSSMLVLLENCIDAVSSCLSMFVGNVVLADRHRLVCCQHHYCLRSEAAAAFDEYWVQQQTVMGGRDFHIQILGVHECGLIESAHMHCAGPGLQDCNMSLFACQMRGLCPVVTVDSASILLNSLLSGYKTPHKNIQPVFCKLVQETLGTIIYDYSYMSH
jgi:hypothetical protein